VSAEPLLGAINLRRFSAGEGGRTIDALTGRISPHPLTGRSTPEPVTGQLHWVVAGAETGFAARPCHPGWARSLRNQAQDAGVPFFWKSWGEWAPDGKPATAYRERADAGKVVTIAISTKSGHPTPFTVAVPADANDNAGPVDVMVRFGKKAAGRLLDGKLYDAMPEVP
jgi:protein gp37